MAQGTNKPDLSDLKARLGLQKPGATKAKQASQDSAQAVAEPAAPPVSSGSARDSASARPPQAGAPARPPSAGPPAGAPRTAGPPMNVAPAPASAPKPAPSPVAEPTPSASAPRADVELDAEDLAVAGGGSAFSPKILVLFAVILGIGVFFGWAGAYSANHSSLYNAQTADAARIQAELEPKIANFEAAQATISKLSPDSIDFEAAAELAKADFAADGNLLQGNRLLLGPALIGQLTDYTVDSAMLKALLVEHDRMTNKVDKKELEQIGQENELLDKERFAILFDYNHLAKHSGDDTYVPKTGRLVTVTSMEKDEDGKIDVALLNSSDTVKTLIQGVLPLAKSDILKTSGPDALQRYKGRVERIKQLTQRVDQQTGPMMTSLKTLSSRDKAGFF